jgi:hypothetical protein
MERPASAQMRFAAGGGANVGLDVNAKFSRGAKRFINGNTSPMNGCFAQHLPIDADQLGNAQADCRGRNIHFHRLPLQRAGQFDDVRQHGSTAALGSRQL